MQTASAQHNLPEIAETLARAYIEAIAHAEGVKIQSMPQKQGSDELAEFLGEWDRPADPDSPFLRADLAAAAVLTARAVAAEPGLAVRLRRGDGPVVCIQTHLAEWVDLVSDVIGRCATSETSRKLIIARDGAEKSHTPSRGNNEVVTVLNKRWPLVGIAPDPKKHLPSTLLRTCEYWLTLPALDEWTIRLVVEAVTCKAFAGDPIDPDLIRGADLTDLTLAFRRDMTPEQCLERLAKTVRSKTRFVGDGPSLEELDGYGPAKSWGLELAADLKEYAAGRLAWNLVDHKGLLLSGAPGTGKTSFAKALAKSSGVPLLATSVADWNSASYLSGTLQAIRTVFAQAKQQAPAILFIDELDGISSRTTLSGEYVEYWSQIVNLLLECLSGIDEREGVVVVAATNHPQKIDPAILRAGRLDHHIVIEKPNTATLARIFRHHVGDELPDVDLMPVALAARGATGADAEAWVRRARATARRSRRDLGITDLLSQVRANAPSLSAEARWRTAVHEAGHVTAGKLLGVGRLVGVSIHEAGGLAEFENTMNGLMTFEAFQHYIVVALAGRAAEQLLLGSVSIGSGNGPDSDLARASELARRLECQYGAGRFGNVFIADGLTDPLPRVPGLLEALKVRVDAAYDHALSLLADRRADLEHLAIALDQRGYLSNDDIETLLGETAPAAHAHEAAE